MNELSLFSGAGGGLLGSVLLGWRTIGAVEIEEYPCKVLRQRQADGMLDEFPIFNMDIREFNKEIAPMYRGVAEVVSAGFPCQPFSVAGKRKGEDDERNMWPATIEAIRIVGPRYVLLENVPGLLAHSYFGTILGELSESGYAAHWAVISASFVGAPHRRSRLWILAYSEQGGCYQGGSSESGCKGGESLACDTGEVVADLQGERRERGGLSVRPRGQEQATCDFERGGERVADSDTAGRRERWAAQSVREEQCAAECFSEGLADTEGSERGSLGEKVERGRGQETGGPGSIEWWSDCDYIRSRDGALRPVKPGIRLLADGVANRVQQLCALGNGQVAGVVEAAWKILGRFDG